MPEVVVETDKEIALRALRWLARNSVGEDKLQAAVTLMGLEIEDVDLGYEMLREIAQSAGPERYRAAHHLLTHARE